MVNAKLLKQTVLLVAYILPFQGFTQEEADRLFARGNYNEAYNAYTEAYPDPVRAGVDIQYKVGICIVNGTNPDKNPAAGLISNYVNAHPDDGNARFVYGKALVYEQRFDEAEEQFTKCLVSKNISDINKKNAGRELEYCQDARVLIPFAINATIETAGEKINSVFSDYYPFTNADESLLYFNSRRNDGSSEKENGDFTSNIYYSVFKDGEFGKPELLKGDINDMTIDEEIVGLSNDGKKALISYINKNGNSDLKIANVDKGKIISYDKLPKELNSASDEIAATFGMSTNEIYFASNREGGFGGIDLYVIRKDPKGKWAKAQNLGPEINTHYDEDFPNLAHDGQALFFSSKGHNSMGGYDIFKAEWDHTVVRFVKPVNIGYPVNTLFDDMNLNFSANGRYGYCSRLTQKAEYDIYRVTFEEVEEQITVVTGILKVDKAEDELLSGLLMVVEDLKTGELMGEYLPNPNTMRYVMAFKPGVYKVTITIDGYETVEEKLVIGDKGGYTPEMTVDYTLKRN
ncbi:MAG TPA: hypothetical protein VD905_00260 [Flavobacteriales bacterium]|nr:hypothetical protein [Flavobacteriales bacterium]